MVPSPGEGRRFRARQFSWWPCPKVKVDRVERDLGPRHTLSCHHHFKFTCLWVPGGHPSIHSLPASPTPPWLSPCRVDTLGHPIPRGSKMPLEPSLEADSIRAAFSIPEALASPFSWTQALLGAGGFLVAESSVCPRPWAGHPISSCLVLNSKASPWPPSSHRCLYFSFRPCSGL